MGLSQKHLRLGQNIRKYRESRGYTLETLGVAADINPSFLAFVERGERNTTTEKLFQLAKALKVNVSDLFKGV